MKFTNRKKLKDFSEKRKIEVFDLLFKRMNIYIEEIEQEISSEDWCEDSLPDEHYLIEEMILKLQPDFYDWYNKIV